MKTRNLFRLCISWLASMILTTVATAANTPAAPRWQPADFSFTAQARPPNPFMISFAATVKGPAGEIFTVPGFFDGSGTWKIRVAPTAEGQWSLVTKSDLKELDDQTATFTCVTNPNPNVHGVLRVDKEQPHHFIFDDGARFFMQGYEYDWLWALDMDKPGVPTVEQSLDLLARHGFNYVILNSYAHDTGWRKGKTGPDDYGPPALCAWEGSNDQPNHSRMNLAFWQHYDRVMTALMERGIQAHMFIKVYNKQVKWPARDSEEEKLFFRWLVARYAAYPNVIWDFSKEAHNEKDLPYKQGVLKYIRQLDPYHHLMTVHDDDQANDSGAYDELTDFRADQQHGKWHEVILRQRERRAWPVVNVEFGYEHGPGGVTDKTYNVVQPPEEVLRRAWEIAMGGGYTAYYYTYTAWDVVRPLEVTPGYQLMKHFGDFWRATEYWKLEPLDKLLNEGWCLANEGREYIVYFNSAKPFTLEIKGASGKLTAQWFNPFTGRTTDAESLGNGTAQFTPPADWSGAPLVLHVRATDPQQGSAVRELVPPLEFSPELAIYPDQPTALSRTVDEIYALTDNTNLTLSAGYPEIRKQIIKMHKDMGIDISIMEQAALAQRPKTWAMRSPKPLAGDFPMPHSIDACFYHKIPSHYPRVKLPIGYIGSVHIATVGQDGDGWGFGIALSGTNDPVRDVCGNQMHVRNDAWSFAPANNGDKHLIFIDGADASFLCTWRVSRNGDGYSARYNGGKIPLLTLGDYGGSNAPHISDLGMMIREGELTDPARGPLEHAVFGPTTKIWNAVVYPAWRTDGRMQFSPKNRGLVPYGGIVQLDPALDLDAVRISGKPLTLPAKRILRAMQEYGWYVNDWGVRDMDFHTSATGSEFQPYGGVRATDNQILAVVNREQLYNVPPLVKKSASSGATDKK